jgi:hypothetical protein
MAQETEPPVRPFPLTLVEWEALPAGDRLPWAHLRQGMLNIITGEGCGVCCGGVTPLEGGQRIECPMRAKLLPKEQESLARTCSLPQLYAEVWAMRRQVTTAEVVAARPEVPWQEWKTTEMYGRTAAGYYRKGWQSLHSWGFTREEAEALVAQLPTTAWTLAPEGRIVRWLELGYYVTSPFPGVTLGQLEQLARQRMGEKRVKFARAVTHVLTLRPGEALALLGMAALAGDEDG